MSALVPVGSYVRELGASIERLLENALDWEHLPHLHAGSFAAIRPLRAGPQGWAAEAKLADGTDIRLDLELKGSGWVTHSHAGDRLVSEIRSTAEATGPDSCRVTVEFLVADTPGLRRKAVGAYYRSLYERLYDEDERMMVARAQALRGGSPAGTRIVALADGSRYEVPLACPHQGLPLTGEPGCDGVIACPWHGYRYDVRTGRCRSPQLSAR